MLSFLLVHIFLLQCLNYLNFGHIREHLALQKNCFISGKDGHVRFIFLNFKHKFFANRSNKFYVKISEGDSVNTKQKF